MYKKYRIIDTLTATGEKSVKAKDVVGGIGSFSRLEEGISFSFFCNNLCLSINSSIVEKIEELEDVLKIHTLNTIYIFKEEEDEMEETSCKIAKTANCLIARNTVDKASVEFTSDGEVYTYEVYDNREVVDMEVIEVYDQEPGVDLVSDVQDALKYANRFIGKYGRENVELLINKEEKEMYVHFHSKHDSFSIYDFEYDVKDDFIVEYIKEQFEENNIDICEY